MQRNDDAVVGALGHPTSELSIGLGLHRLMLPKNPIDGPVASAILALSFHHLSLIHHSSSVLHLSMPLGSPVCGVGTAEASNQQLATAGQICSCSCRDGAGTLHHRVDRSGMNATHHVCMCRESWIVGLRHFKLGRAPPF